VHGNVVVMLIRLAPVWLELPAIVIPWAGASRGVFCPGNAVCHQLDLRATILKLLAPVWLELSPSCIALPAGFGGPLPRRRDGRFAISSRPDKEDKGDAISLSFILPHCLVRREATKTISHAHTGD